MLADAGAVSHEEAISWAQDQYSTFVERRRLEAEAAAEARYLDDLRSSAKKLETERKSLPSVDRKRRKRRKESENREPGGKDTE